MSASFKTIVCAALFLLIWLQGCVPSSGQVADESAGMVLEVVDHTLFDNLLSKYVDEEGEVDYASIKDGNELGAYIQYLEQVEPSALSGQEALAFWINAYNAYTIKLIVDNYPVKTIKSITPLRLKGLSLAIPKINSPFEYNIAEIAGRKYSLDDIEHGILRKEFDEPRIHFALVCAAYSCPPLRGEAFVASRLDEQLDDQGMKFLHDTRKNKIDGSKKHIQLSKIFKWFKSDFTTEGRTLQQFLAPYFEGATRQKLLANGFDVRYLKYNWKLNDKGVYNK